MKYIVFSIVATALAGTPVALQFTAETTTFPMGTDVGGSSSAAAVPESTHVRLRRAAAVPQTISLRSGAAGAAHVSNHPARTTEEPYMTTAPPTYLTPMPTH